MSSVSDLLKGIVVESRTQSWTGPLFYGDKTYLGEHEFVTMHLQHPLNELSTWYVVGIAAGVTRMGLAAIHMVGHSFAALVTFDKGHCYHIAKGACEFLRGFIEAVPVAGRIFARSYYEDGFWWIIKIYNPDAPDSLDRHNGCWNRFRQMRPTGYVTA